MRRTKSVQPVSGAWIGRDPRVPLHLLVRARPALGECWCLNLSLGGMAMAVASPPDKLALAEGMELVLELTLPGSGATLHPRAKVVWFNERGDTRERRGRVTVGVEFTELSNPERSALERFLADYRPGVAVAASPAELTRAQDVLPPDFQVHGCNNLDELGRALGRGDVQVVVVGGPEAEVLRKVDHVDALTGDAYPVAAPGRAVTPRVVVVARAESSRLRQYQQDGKIFQIVSAPVEGAALQAAVRRACYDFLLRAELRRALLELERLKPAAPDATVSSTRQPTRELVFNSEAMRKAMDLLCIVAPHKAHVLLSGETGTGKELLARSLHDLSDRAAGPFVTVDCGALTETLLESELFGHMQGAFTGATASRPGLFQLADGGSLFLDEIENTTPALQVKLLRVLDTGEIRPVGGSKTTRVDVRLVAATNRELAADVRDGRFRADLYYRLNAFPIHLPPLRGRREDVVPLAQHFIERFAREMKRAPAALSERAVRMISTYAWPGNVRELRNAMERAVLLCPPGQQIEPAVLPPALWADGEHAGETGGGGSLNDKVIAFERELLAEALRRHGGVVRRAAIDLQASPVTLARKARRYGLV